MIQSTKGKCSTCNLILSPPQPPPPSSSASDALSGSTWAIQTSRTLCGAISFQQSVFSSVTDCHGSSPEYLATRFYPVSTGYPNKKQISRDYRVYGPAGTPTQQRWPFTGRGSMQQEDVLSTAHGYFTINEHRNTFNTLVVSSCINLNGHVQQQLIIVVLVTLPKKQKNKNLKQS